MKIYDLIKTKTIFVPYYNEKLSATLSYKIFKLCNFIEQEEQFYNQKMQSIIEEFGKRTDDGNLVIDDAGNVKIIEDRIDDAHKAIEELRDIEVEAPSVEFTLDELSGMKLSVRDISVLEPFIKEV